MQRAPLPVYITTDMLGPNKPMPVILTDMNGAAKPTPIYDVNAEPDYYTKVESDARFANKSDTTVAINELRDDLDVNTVDIMTLEQNIANVYTKAETYNKTEADNKFAEKATTYTKSETYSKTQSDSNFLHLGTPEQVVSQVPFFNRGIKVGAYSVDIPAITICATNYAETDAKTLFVPPFDSSSASIIVSAPKTDQGISHRLKSAVAFQAPTFEFQGTNILTIGTSLQNAVRTLTVPILSSDADILVSKPLTPQVLDRLTFNTGVFLRTPNANYVQVTSGDQADNNKYISVPPLSGGSDMIVTKATTGQTISTRLTNDISYRTFKLELCNSGVYTKGVSITSSESSTIKNVTIPEVIEGAKFIMSNVSSTQQVLSIVNFQKGIFIGDQTATYYDQIYSDRTLSANRIVTIPNGSTNTSFILATAATEQTISNIRINSLNLNGYTVSGATNTISGTTEVLASDYAVKSYVDTGLSTKINTSQIVTTVTGSSDTNIPSEKAVKTYVDGHLSGGSIQSLTSLVWSTANWGTYLTLPYEMFNVEGYHKIALKIINNAGTIHYGTFAVVGFPEFSSIRVQISGYSTLTTALTPEYQNVNQIFSKLATTETSPYASGSTNGTYFNNWVNGGDVVYAGPDTTNHGIKFDFDAHVANRIGTYTIETWVSFIL